MGREKEHPTHPQHSYTLTTTITQSALINRLSDAGHFCILYFILGGLCLHTCLSITQSGRVLREEEMTGITFAL